MSDTRYLGVDGGGTRTTAWVADARGRVLGRGRAGPANPLKVGLARAQREILAAAEQALARGRGGQLESVCVGIAGSDRPEIAEPLLRWLRRKLPAGTHLVTTDAAIALEAARCRWPVIVVIAGTGSIACARGADGTIMRAGGWGALFDDDGSGFDLGRQGVHAALCAIDGRGPHTALTRVLPPALGVGDIREAVGLGLSTSGVAALAPVVIRCGCAGDAVSRALLDAAGKSLAGLALALIRRLGLLDQKIAVVCAGGLLEGNATMRGLLARCLHAQAPQARVSRLTRPAVQGALDLALRSAGSRTRSRPHVSVAP